MGRTTAANTLTTKPPRKPDLILCSDLHLRESTPKCRTDDFPAAMWRKFQFLCALGEEHKCPVVVAGDVFHHWKCSPALVNRTIDLMHPVEWLIVPGQHDLPNHQLTRLDESSLWTLFLALPKILLLNAVPYLCGGNSIYGFPWGTELHEPQDTPPRHTTRQRRVTVAHLPCWAGKSPYPGAPPEGNALKILESMPWADLIVTGDNHQSFDVQSRDGRWLVNPGSMMRSTADQADHKPRVVLWYAEDNSIESVYFPVEEGVVSREHIDREQQRDARIEAFVSRLVQEDELPVSFRENLERFVRRNSIPKLVEEMIWECVEGEVTRNG